MTSDSMKRWHVDKLRETLATIASYESVEGHEPGSASWYAYQLGRLEVQAESLANIVEEDLPPVCKANLGDPNVHCSCANGIGCVNVPLEKW